MFCLTLAEILARRLEFHGPGVMRMTQRNFAANAPWDALIGLLIAGAQWRRPPGAGSNTQRTIELADAEKNEMLMSFIHGTEKPADWCWPDWHVTGSNKNFHVA